MGLFDNNKKKSNEMTLPLLSSIADVVTSVGSGYAQGFEKAIDSGASLVSWYARLAGMDNAERKINEFIAKDLIGDGSRMADYFEQHGSVLGDKARSVLSTGGSFLNPGTFFPTGLGAQPTYLETREALQEEQPEYMRRWNQMISPLTSTIDDIKAQVGVGAAKSVEGILDAGATAGAWGARILGADRAEKAITNWIADDHIGNGSEYADYYTKKGSILGDGAGGEIVRGVSQGVGQMLPSVAVSLIPGVGQAGALATLGLSAGGGGVEEALSEGAGLGRATLYGAAVAGTELATEKLVGGPMAKVFGGGWLDDVTGSVLKVGAGRVAKEAVGEGVEEGLAELASPLLKSIYKGVDAFSEYGDKDYWKGVGESALIGAGTSVAFGGTVGHAMGTSGKAADVASLADDISSNAKRRMELYREGKITEGDENDRRTSRTMLADYQKLQEILQKTDATERSRLIKANNLGGVVDENGTVRPSVLASLTIENADSQTPTGEQNAAQGKKTPLSGAYLSPGLWRQSEKVQSDLAGISDDLKANGKEGKPVELFRGELSEAAQENYNAFKRAASKLSLQSDNKLQFALIDAPSGVSGVHRGGTVYLNTKTLEDGKWARVLFEEATHFTDGTAEAADFKAFLEKEDGLFEDVAEGLLAQGNAYGFTDENVMGEKSETFNREMYAQMASRVLTSPEYVDKLVRADRTLAEKIKNRISDVAETLRSVTNKDIEIRKQLRRATKAQGLFERALEGADGKGTEVDFLFAGKNAKTADKMRLATAEKMLEGGVDSETIRKETGWHQGYDGKWRFEIDDFDSRTIENPKIERHDDDGEIYYTGELGDIFDHKLLFEAYPELKDINIVIQPTDYGVDAIYQPNSNYITLSREHFKRYTKEYEDYLNGGRKDEIAKIEQTPEFLEYEKWYDDEVADNMDSMEWLAGEKAAREKFFSSELGKRYHQLKYSKDGFTGDKFEAGWGKEAKAVLLHELQHAIQNIEGFATGTNTKDPNYDKNAGEIEAYDAGRRANMTAEERKNTRPEIDRPDAVVRRNGIYYDANSKRAQEDAVRTQIRDHLDEINQMEPVTKITFDSSKITDNIIAKKMAVEEFKNFGSQIDRQGFGIILIGKDEIGTGIGYVHTPAERAALLTVPKVLKRGKIIYEKDNHKGNGFPTVTIAAPVVINGKKVVVAAVVQKTGKNKYHAHRVLLPDGSVFVLEKTDAELSTASMLSIETQQRLPNNSASSISIPQNSKMSTPKSDFSMENVSEEADRSADVANQQASDATKERKGVTTVEDVARDLSRYANVKSGTRKELLRKLSDLYSAMESGQITAEEQTEQLQQIADYLVANRKDPVIRRDEYMQEVLDTLKSSKVTLTDAQKAEVRSTYQNFNEWRSQMMGGVDIVNAGTKLDVLWDEWAEKFPNIFQDVTETDMPGELLRIYKTARDSQDAGDIARAELYDAQTEQIAAALPQMISDAFWSVGKKITPEYRKMLSAIAERDDARAEVKQKERQIAEERREAQRELQAAEANAARERDQVEQEMTRRTNDIERLGNAVKNLNTKAKDNKTRLFSPAIYRSDVLKKVFSDLGGISASNVNSGTVRDRIADLYEWYSDEENNIFPEIMEKNPDTERVLMNISKGKGELTREEIKSLTNVVTYFGTVADHLQTCVKDGERTDAMPLAEQFVKVAKESDEKTAAAIRSAKRMFGKNKQLNYWEQFGRPETVGKIADNFSDGFFTYIMNEAQIAEVKKGKLRIDLARDVEQYLSNDKKYLGRLEKGEITFRGESMTVAEAVQLYLLLGRDQAKVHLFLGGFELQHDDKRIKCAPLRQMEDEDVRGMKPEEIIDAAEDACKIARAELSALMTESDLEFAEMLRQKYNGAMKQAKIKGDIQKQGYSNVEAGEDYAPMRIAQKVETADLSYQALEKVDRYAFNKQVYQLANNALLIQPAHKVFATHAEELATYVEIRPVVESFNIMYNLDVNNNRRNPETIKSAVERKGGFTRRAAQYTKDLLKDLQGDRFKDTRASFINDIVGKLRETFALSTLALNVNSWGSQLSSYIAAGSELRMSDLMRAGIGLYGRAKTADNVINKYSTVAMIRSYEGYATKARTLIDKTTGLSNKLMGVTSALDRFVVRRLWKVCLLQTCGSISAAKNATAEQMQKAGELLDHVILKTQQNAMVTTRSAAMRSNNELAKGVTAFSADGMMQSAQGLESTLEVEALKNQKKEALKQAKTAEETKRILEEYNPKIKAAKKKAGMAIGSMMMSSVYLAAISMAWQYIRGKLDDEEKIGMNFLWTAIGNLFGGLPIVRDLYDIFAEGYEAEFFAYTAFNDLAKNTSTMVEMTFDILSGKEVTSQEIARNLRSTVFAAGTLFGLPFRNVSNMARAALGLIGIADESIPYKFDNVFYEQSYNKDLEKALLDGDDQMVDTIVGIMLDQDGGEMNEGTRRATAKLIKSGYEGILPRSIPETLTNAQDVEIELTKKQRQQFEKVYSAAYRAADDLVRMGYFKAASKDEQAYALKFIWSTYYALAKDTVLGEDSTKKNVLFAEAIPVERLALIVAQASAIKADVDKNGKAINGSRMHKIEALIESLHLSAAQKYMMMGYLGYTNKKGRELVERYIRTLGLSQAEQAELLEMSGYPEK